MKNHGQIILCGAIAYLFWAGLYMCVPVLAPYAQSLGASLKMIGWIGGSYGLMQLILRVPIGVISDKFNRKKSLVSLGMFLIAVASVCFFASKTPVGLLASRALTGVAASFLGIITMTFSSNFKDKAKGIGILNACLFGGLFSAAIVSGYLAQHFGEKMSFSVGILLGLMGFILSFFLKENKVEKSNLKITELLSVGKERPILFYAILGIVLEFSCYGTTYVFTPLLAERAGATESQLGLLLFIFTIPSVFSTLLIGTKAFQKIKKNLSVPLIFLIISLPSIPILFTKSIEVIYFCQFIAGFGRGVGFAFLLFLIIDNAPKNKTTTATCFYQAAYALGMFAGPIFTGLVGVSGSLTMPYLLIVGICVITSIAAFFVIPTLKKSMTVIESYK